MAELSPMMKQYFSIKEENKDSIVFFSSAIFTKCFLMMLKLHRKNWN